MGRRPILCMDRALYGYSLSCFMYMVRFLVLCIFSSVLRWRPTLEWTQNEHPKTMSNVYRIWLASSLLVQLCIAPNTDVYDCARLPDSVFRHCHVPSPDPRTWFVSANKLATEGWTQGRNCWSVQCRHACPAAQLTSTRLTASQRGLKTHVYRRKTAYSIYCVNRYRPRLT